MSLETQLADAIRLAEDEAKERLHLMSKFRNAESDRESMRQHLEETLEEKEDMMRQLSRANGEATLWRSKWVSVVETTYILIHLLTLMLRTSHLNLNCLVPTSIWRLDVYDVVMEIWVFIFVMEKCVFSFWKCTSHHSGGHNKEMNSANALWLRRTKNAIFPCANFLNIS